MITAKVSLDIIAIQHFKAHVTLPLTLLHECHCIHKWTYLLLLIRVVVSFSTHSTWYKQRWSNGQYTPGICVAHCNTSQLMEKTPEVRWSNELSQSWGMYICMHKFVHSIDFFYCQWPTSVGLTHANSRYLLNWTWTKSSWNATKPLCKLKLLV